MSDQERWQLSDRGAESYERFQVPSMFGPLARAFLAQVPLRPGQRVLDVACGTGIVARLAAPAVGPDGRVAGVDLNPGMIAVARREDPAIDWREADVAALPFEDGAFDVVLCQQGLQFVPDKSAALAEMHRVLAAGGCLALCLWQGIEHSPYMHETSKALTRYVGADAGSRIQAPFALGDAEAVRAMVRDAGFPAVEIRETVVTRRMLPPEEAVPGHLASTPVGPQVAALDAETRAALVATIAAALAQYRDEEGMAVPQGAYIALATKP
jgi:ubiquinone/menaquinone biosynthesis C-methylase UbiE